MADRGLGKLKGQYTNKIYTTVPHFSGYQDSLFLSRVTECLASLFDREYCKFENFCENFIFANIRELVASRFQGSR